MEHDASPMTPESRPGDLRKCSSILKILKQTACGGAVGTQLRQFAEAHPALVFFPVCVCVFRFVGVEDRSVQVIVDDASKTCHIVTVHAFGWDLEAAWNAAAFLLCLGIRTD